MRILILGLGNELLGDDRIGLLAARALREELEGSGGLVIEGTPLSGLALLDWLVGYERAILIDAVQTGQAPPGTIWRWKAEELGRIRAPSPHYAGLPELLALARALQLPFPEQIEIFAVEVADPTTVGGDLTPSVRQALPELIRRIRERVREWQEEALPGSLSSTER